MGFYTPHVLQVFFFPGHRRRVKALKEMEEKERRESEVLEGSVEVFCFHTRGYKGAMLFESPYLKTSSYNTPSWNPC